MVMRLKSTHSLRKSRRNWRIGSANIQPAYSDAYMQLSAPSIFAFYVRLELLHWAPLYGSAGFDSMTWYKLLYDFGVQANGQSVDEDDADVNLIPELVEKVALPVLHHELGHCWDVLSTRGTKRAVITVQDMLIYVDAANSEPLQEMLAAVCITHVSFGFSSGGTVE